MNLTQLGNNKTEISFGGGLTVLFSYETPVACRWTANGNVQFYRTDKKWSNTTSRHISQWVSGDVIKKPQEYFDNLVKGA